MYEIMQMPYHSSELFDKVNKILVVAPHCDDEVFGCGGSLAKASARGATIRVIVVSQDSEFDKRKEESLNASKILGYDDIRFWEFEDGKVKEKSKELYEKLLKEFREFIPSLICVTSLWEMHRDHIACTLGVIEALKTYKKDVTVAFYEVGIPLIPTDLIDISKVYNKKIEAMKCFKTQQEKQNYLKQREG